MSANAADAYAAATDLIARSAAAYVASVPDHPADDGFFGPASVTWRVSTDLTAPVAGLGAPSAYLAVVSFGDRDSAQRTAARVRRIHEHVRGVDPVTGRRYEASDPALLLWVHATLVESGIAAGRLLGTPLPDSDADRYVAEMVIAAELV